MLACINVFVNLNADLDDGKKPEAQQLFKKLCDELYLCVAVLHIVSLFPKIHLKISNKFNIVKVRKLLTISRTAQHDLLL